jgi:glycosyltransferase involved in cell wall biosynthesis
VKKSYESLNLSTLPQPPAGKVGWPWTKNSRPFPKYSFDGSTWPCVSIITPSYNQGQFLEETVRSVLLQGYPNLEYIIIDGGSTDNSVEVIKKYESHITYWTSEKDKGQAHAINKGLNTSSGTILGWINSDDLYTRDTLRKVIQAFYKHQHCTLVHGDRILINENSEVTGCSLLTPFRPKTNSYNIASETVFWKRNAMEKTGLLKEDLQFAMDLEFFCRLYLHGQFLKLNEYLGYFRCYSFNKSSTIAHIGLEEATEEWESIFGSKFTMQKGKTSRLALLKSFITNPQLAGLPYAKYKISKYLRNRV